MNDNNGNTTLSRYIGRFKDPRDGYPPFLEIWAYDNRQASEFLLKYCHDNSFSVTGLYAAPVESRHVPDEPGFRDFERGERPGAYSKQNELVKPASQKERIRRLCPICGNDVCDDPRNPGKVLCKTCKKRMPVDAAVLIRPEEDEKPAVKYAASIVWLVVAIVVFVIAVAASVVNMVITLPDMLRIVSMVVAGVSILALIFCSAMLLRGRREPDGA